MLDLLTKFAGRPSSPGTVGVVGDTAVYTDPAANRFDSPAPSSLPITWWIVSTEDVDRDGDVVRSGQWETDNWQRAGAPCLWDHGESSSLPIGSAIHPETGELMLRQENGRTLAGIHHTTTHPLGKEVYDLVMSGLVKTASIGFLPKDKEPIRKAQGFHGSSEKGPWEIQSLDLVEITLTPTASNPNALRIKGMSDIVRKSFVKAMGTLADTAGGVLVEPESKEDDPGAMIHKDIQDCVSAKIKKFMDEGMKQDQAIAAAYHYCGEEKAAKLREGETMPEIVEKSKDSSGHEHASDTGQFTSGSGGGTKKPKEKLPKKGSAKAPVSIRQAQDAAMKLGDRRTAEIVGPGGLSGASAKQLETLVAEANGKSSKDTPKKEVSIIRQAQDAAMSLGDDKTDEIVGPGGLSGASERQLRLLIAAAGHKSNGRGKTIHMVTKAVDVDELQDSPVAEDAGSVILPGHKILANVCEHIKALIDWLKDERGSLQHEDIADYVDSELTEVLEELHESARAKGSEHYPESEAFQGSDGEDESPEGVGDEDEFGEIEKSETDNEDFPESEEEGDESDKEGKKSKTPNEATEDDADAAVNGRTTEEENPRDADAGNEYAEGIPEGEQAERADEYTSRLARPPKKKKRLEEYRKKFYARKGYRMSKAAASVCMKACGQMDDSAEHLEKSAESDETPAEHGYMHKGHAAMLRKHAGEVRKAIGVGTESSEGEAEYDAKGENHSPGAESEMGEREWDKHLPSILGALETIGQKATKLDNTVKRIQGK